MVQESPGIEELKSRIGVEWPPRSYEIEKGMVQRFVRAIDDANPLWQDGVTAPPTLVVTLGLELIEQARPSSDPAESWLHGSTELECYRPIRTGDVITVSVRVSDIRQRQGKMGKMTFVTFDMSYENQRSEAVARCRQMVISY